MEIADTVDGGNQRSGVAQRVERVVQKGVRADRRTEVVNLRDPTKVIVLKSIRQDSIGGMGQLAGRFKLNVDRRGLRVPR